MQQLASFEPDDDQTFGDEVEEFRRKLEQAYRLCPRCERQLRRTLNRVKQTVLGSKLAQIGAHGLRAFDLHMSATNQLVIAKRKRRLTHLFGATLIVLSVINLIRTSRTVRLTRTALNLVFPASVSSVLLVAYAFGAICMKYAWKGFDYVSDCVRSKEWISSNWDRVSSSLGLDELEKLAREQAPVWDVHTINTEHWASISAILLCLFVVWMNDFRRGSVLMLLAWSIKCALPSALSGIYSFDSAAYLLVIFDLSQLLIDLFVLITSGKDAFTRSDRVRLQNQSANSSFHRIYTDTDDLSDQSDDETVLSSSPSSFRKNQSPRTPLNASINTTRSVSPSVFTPSTLRGGTIHSSMNSLNRSFCKSNNDFLPRSNNNYQTHQELNPFYDVPDDFQSGITQLNISGKYGPSSSIASPPLAAHSFHTSSQDAPPRRYHSHYHPSLLSSPSIIGPSRLLQQKQHNPTTDNTITSSWIAGGYWNAAHHSPTKHSTTILRSSQLVPAAAAVAASVPQLTSPTSSSQSSGFESRESSISPAIYPSDSVSQCGVEPPLGSAIYHPRSVVTQGPSSLGTWTTNQPNQQQQLRFRTTGTEIRFPQSQHVPAFERGSLLRAWTQRTSRSQLDVRQTQ